MSRPGRTQTAADIDRVLMDEDDAIDRAVAEEQDARRNAQRGDQRADQRSDDDFMPEDNDDRFYVDPAWIPEGMDWQWKAETVVGKESTEHMSRMYRNRWAPVTGKDCPSLRAWNLPDSEPIRRGGQILMQRPKFLTNKMRLRESRRANEQLDTQLARVNEENRARGAGNAKLQSSHELIPND